VARAGGRLTLSGQGKFCDRARLEPCLLGWLHGDDVGRQADDSKFQAPERLAITVDHLDRLRGAWRLVEVELHRILVKESQPLLALCGRKAAT
jgi:hypothetical protein